ncbi:MAG: glycosyltransferase, partial [Promethearchaeota archaeon]
ITSGLKCGITDYTKNLISELRKFENSEVQYYELQQGIFRFSLLSDILRSDAKIVHIQHEIVMFDRFFGLTSLFIYFYARLMRKKIITTFHSVKSLSNFENEIASRYRKNRIIISFAKIYLKILFKLTSLSSDRILVLSKSAKDVLENEYNIKNISYIFHGFFNPIESDDNTVSLLRKKLGLDSSDKIILLFGYPFENKGYHRVIESMPYVLKKHPEAKIIITGGIGLADPEQCLDYLNRLKQMSKDLKVNSSVIFTEYIPDEEVPCLLSISVIAIFPFEDRQTASGSVATVYSYRIPMIVSDIDAFDFLENGKDCIKIKLGNEMEIVNAINLLLGDFRLCNKFKKNMEARLETKSIKKAAEEHIQVYRQIINE